MLYPGDPETRPGSRVLHVPAGTPTHPSRSGHRLGGHPSPVQEPVESAVARGVLGPDATRQDSEWVLLAQSDTDEAADMMWGDTGTVYWLIRPADLAAGRFEEAMFTWQCRWLPPGAGSEYLY
ncbi:DUF1963 domain-containing protein [Streptomyces erythrochromogenes]|uniref:DUF1963 domain-containing protein n=1 Tax=Streptomyces erythrochromogenes TaxID=285574 RepID=UPI003677E29B